MQQELSVEMNAEADAIKAAKEADAQIWERQNFILGCDEMERITDDIIVPVFSTLAKAIKSSGYDMDIILMDCESPLDEKLYNVGVRLSFNYSDTDVEISIIADPSDFTFTLNILGASSEEVNTEFKFHEVVPVLLQKELKLQFDKNFSKIEFTPSYSRSDTQFEKFEAPFRVQYDDNGSVSDVATTKTLLEAANMGSTFAKMFKKEDAITVIDANDAVVC